MIVAVMKTFFQKTLIRSQKVAHNFQKTKEQKIVSSPSKTIALDDSNFESKESFLIGQSISSTLIHELNLYSNTEM